MLGLYVGAVMKEGLDFSNLLQFNNCKEFNGSYSLIDSCSLNNDRDVYYSNLIKDKLTNFLNSTLDV